MGMTKEPMEVQEERVSYLLCNLTPFPVRRIGFQNVNLKVKLGP